MILKDFWIVSYTNTNQNDKIEIIFCIFFVLELAAENRLSVVKRKGLVDHLLKYPTVKNGAVSKECPVPGPRQRPFIKRPKSHLDSITTLRRKEAIVSSGAYERSTVPPPKGRGMMIHAQCFRTYTFEHVQAP